jgi:MFS family permease
MVSLLSVGLFGITFLMPILLQDVLGQTALKCGLIMFPGAIASGLIMPFSGWFFDRYGAKGIVIAGTAIITGTTFMMHSFNDLTPFSYMTMLIMIRGLGLGLCMMPVTNAAMNAAPPHLVGRASATINQVQQVSASFGIAILSTIMQNRQVFHATRLAEAANLSTSTTGLGMQGRLIGLAYQLGMAAGMSRALSLGLVFIRMEYLSMIQAIDDVFVVAAALCVLAFMLSFFLMDVRKRRPVPSGVTGSTRQEGIALKV